MISKTRKARRLPLMLLTLTLIGGLVLAACGSFGVQVNPDGDDGFTITGQADGGDDGAVEVAPADSGGDGSTMNTNTVLLVGVGLAILIAVIALGMAGSRRNKEAL